MTREMIAQAVANLDDQYLQEAENDFFEGKNNKLYFSQKRFGKALAAAVLALCLLGGGLGLLTHPDSGMMVTAYAYDTDAEITPAGVELRTGTISDSGEMVGHPLMFFLSGEKIATVRFSCKNQQLSFMDWTEKRAEYGLAQNFTVLYGEDESEYDSLVIDWVPNATIRALTDDDAAKIATLPDELRNDVIVMEITFPNGKIAVKALTVSLLDDGTFFAAFHDYEIRETDTFVNRADSAPLPTASLSAQMLEPTETDLPANDALFTAQEVRDAREAALSYYAGTVFTVHSIQYVGYTPHNDGAPDCNFSVCVSKGGVVQEPNRMISLQWKDGAWEVVNEGY